MAKSEKRHRGEGGREGTQCFDSFTLHSAAVVYHRSGGGAGVQSRWAHLVFQGGAQRERRREFCSAPRSLHKQPCEPLCTGSHDTTSPPAAAARHGRPARRARRCGRRVGTSACKQINPDGVTPTCTRALSPWRPQESL